MLLDLKVTVVVILLAIVGFFVITAWDEVIDRWIFDYFNLDRDKISSWLIVATIATLSLFALLLIFNIEVHDVLGVGEAVDVKLSGRQEAFSKGKVKHSPAY